MTTQGSNMRLPRSTPEAQGISTSAISKFLDDVDEKIFYLNSFMLIRHGNVVAEGWLGSVRAGLYSPALLPQ